MTDPLAQQLAPTFNPLDDSDWLEVVRRARRPGRRRGIVLAAAVAAALVLLAAVPLGLAGRVAHLIEGSPAPPEVRTYFAANDDLRKRLFEGEAAAGRAIQARYSPTIAGDARGIAAIESPDGPIYLWAAPTEDGGQCWLIQAGADDSTQRPYGTGGCDDGRAGPGFAADTGWTVERPSVQILHARVYDEAAATVDVELVGGGRVTLAVVSGHALGTIPKDARVAAYVERDGDGKEVARVDY